MGGWALGKRERGEGMRNGGEGRGGVGACGGSEDGGRGYKAGAGESGYGKGKRERRGKMEGTYRREIEKQDSTPAQRGRRRGKTAWMCSRRPCRVGTGGRSLYTSLYICQQPLLLFA